MNAKVATASIALAFTIVPFALAAEPAEQKFSPPGNADVNTGVPTRNPATNAAGVNGLPGNKSGKATTPDKGNNGNSAGEHGENSAKTQPAPAK